MRECSGRVRRWEDEVDARELRAEFASRQSTRLLRGCSWLLLRRYPLWHLQTFDSGSHVWPERSGRRYLSERVLRKATMAASSSGLNPRSPSSSELTLSDTSAAGQQPAARA
jgi:hypothetical protein